MESFKKTDYNPFAGKQSKPQARQYERPDPSKKVDCSEDRPIKVNPSGKYNLNFIDWENEFDNVYDYNSGGSDEGECPIYGMDLETFKAIRDEESQEWEQEFGVKREFYERFPIREATKDSTDKDCSICLKHYKPGCKVFFLPCKHHFHI